jgi:peroxiredoxin
MRTWLNTTLLMLSTATTAQAALQVGDLAPPIEVRASRGGQAFDFSLQRSLRQGPVVVYFYPAAFSKGCSVQAHTFAVNLDKFAAAGASVIGVSLDGIEQLNRFSADPDSCGGKVAVASDADGRVTRAFDLVVRPAEPGRKDRLGQDVARGRAERTTFVVTPDGRIAATLGGLAPVDNVERALGIVQGLARTGPR